MNSDQRIHEKDLVIPALRLASQKTDGFISTSELIEELEIFFNVSGEDAEILLNRNDIKFSQKVRNLISHRKYGPGLVANGYAEYDEGRNGISITQKGRDLVDNHLG